MCDHLIYVLLQAMYPTIVYIVLAETPRSMTDICVIGLSNTSRIAVLVASDHEARTATVGHPPFAVGPFDNSAMDDEAESLRSRVSQSQDVQEHGLQKVVRS